MAYNPFLSMTEPAAAPMQMATEVLNPFMMTDAEPVTFAGDNPFATSNPFSDFGDGGFEPAAGDTVPLDIFGNVEPTGGGARLFDMPKSTPAPSDIFGTAPPPVKPTELDLTLAPPTRPLPPETQSLILSVTGQMEVASSHLLDRIPPTRTPSPVSARDLHSPSPTPEPDLELDPEPLAQQGPTAPIVDGLDINRNRPARPPPARPPPVPRPPPPRPAPPPALPTQPQSQQAKLAQDDDINLFDAPAPTVVKPTKEAILSLYSATKKEEEKPIDFLSDDILENMPAKSGGVSVPTMSTAPITSAMFTDAGTNPPATAATPDSLFAAESAAPMDCSEPPVPPALPARQESPQATAKATAAVSPTSSPFADVTSNNSYSPMPVEEEGNPFQDIAATDTLTFTNHNTNIFAATTAEDSFTVSGGDVFVTVAADTFGTASDTFTTAPVIDHSQKDIGGDASNAFDGASHDQNVFDTNETDAFPAVALPTTDPGWGAPQEPMDTHFKKDDAFDDFSAKFESVPANHMNTGAWGEDSAGAGSDDAGFESEAFDPFLSMGAPPPPAATPRLEHQGSRDSTDDSFSVFIRPKEELDGERARVPALAPPPLLQAVPDSPRANPFDKSVEMGPVPPPMAPPAPAEEHEHRHSGSETPPTPLFDEDTSVPLEDFPRTKYDGPGWEMQLRQPNKKKITGQRFWKKIFVRLAQGQQGDSDNGSGGPVVQLRHAAADREPFQELPLQACYSVSEVAAQQYDQFGKIFTVKLQYVFYKERPGVRPGQVTKAERITNKLSQFAAYAIQGDYQGVKEFGSDLRKLGLPVEHAPQVSQLFKVGSLSYEDVRQFACGVEEALFRLPAHRDRALHYKMEEVQITAVDELYVEQDAEGGVTRQIARVRLFFLGFLSGMPDVEIGVNDLRRQGREVVGRHDIIPVATEEWIRVERAEFHACVQPEEFEATQIIKCKPPDACYVELMRFRVRPPKNRELPLQLKAAWVVAGNKVELRADVLVPGFASRKLGQVPCEDVAIRFPIPECWIYLFRVEKHFRYGSVKSAHRRTGKIKGIERFLGAVDTLSESLIEVTSGQAKYEHQHRAIVWRMPRLPKEGQGAYTTHNLVCRMALTSYDQVPAALAPHALVEFTMPATQVSHMTVRSVSLQNHDGDPPEKCVRYLARHEYLVGIERTSGQAAPAYALAAAAPSPPAPPAPVHAAAPPLPQPPSSDSDSD